MSPDYREAASAAVNCLRIRASDRVLVVYNLPQRAVANALASAARPRSSWVDLLEYQALSRDGEEPPPFISRGIGDATAVFAPTERSLSHTKARMDATARGTRIATLPGITDDAFRRGLPVDYAVLRRLSRRLATQLTSSSTCHLTSRNGTDIWLDLEDRTATSDDGDLGSEGSWGNLPAGEAYIAPVEGRAEGTLVLDGALAGYGILSRPLHLRIRSGVLQEADGEGASWLLSRLDAGGPAGRVVAELGIGTNPGARLTGMFLEDEKALGTAHVAFGTNLSFGGNNMAGVHIDGLLLRPSIELDGHLVVEGGQHHSLKDL